MKFEIDDKTGMLQVDNDGFGVYWPSEAKELEKILQAVKKTQEKLVNKQIQEIQDSKNEKYDLLTMVGQLEKGITSPDPVVLEDLFDEFQEMIQNSTTEKTKKIEQNQKIVDGIKDFCNNKIDDSLRGYKYIPGIISTLEAIVRKSTGKDIHHFK